MADILIADDHPLFRDALRRAVLAAVPGSRVQDADSVNALYALLERFPDAELLLLDLHMPGAHGFSALAHIRGQLPALPIIVVSVHEEARVARRAIGHGASAYVPKSADAKDIVAAIRAVLDGDVWVPRGLRLSDAGLDADEAAAAGRIASLTPQQFRVLTMTSAGLLNKQIAFELGVSEATVKAHMTAVMRKLGVNNRTQVALLARTLAIEPDSLTVPLDPATE
ncbi:MAG TPA: response regulator transcription factor [Rhodanobacteraceae bacterium]